MNPQEMLRARPPLYGIRSRKTPGACRRASIFVSWGHGRSGLPVDACQNFVYIVHMETIISPSIGGRPAGLSPDEERVATALSAVIKAAGLDATEALRVMRRVSEEIELPKAAPDASFERVRLRSLGADDELRDAEGGGLSDAEFAARLKIKSRETIRQYREKHRIFGWRKDLRSYRYPAWQIHHNQLLPGLERVIVVLTQKGLQPLSIIGYFLTPSSDLDDVRPLDLLREGRVEEVVPDAERYGEIGT
jgi:hypothetical protein